MNRSLACTVLTICLIFISVARAQPNTGPAKSARPSEPPTYEYTLLEHPAKPGGMGALHGEFDSKEQCEAAFSTVVGKTPAVRARLECAKSREPIEYWLIRGDRLLDQFGSKKTCEAALAAAKAKDRDPKAKYTCGKLAGQIRMDFAPPNKR